MSAGGLLLALVAVTSAGRGPATGPPAGRLVAHLSDPLIALAGALVSAAVLVLLVLSWPTRRRRRRKDAEDVELAHEPPRMSPWAHLVLWVLAVAPLAAAAYVVWYGAPLLRDVLATLGAPRAAAPPPVGPPRPEVPAPLFGAAVALLALLVGVGSLAGALWLALGDRLARWWAGLEPAPASGALEDAAAESLDDLRLEGDARRAIIACYRRFEVAAARSGLPRAPWETPMEFMRAALRDRPLPEAAVERLTALFERARFSQHPVGPAERDQACASVGEIRVALEGGRARASSG